MFVGTSSLDDEAEPSPTRRVQTDRSERKTGMVAPLGRIARKREIY